MKQVKRRKKRPRFPVNPLGNYYTPFLILHTVSQIVDIERLAISSGNYYEWEVTTQNMTSAELTSIQNLNTSLQRRERYLL